MSWLPWTLEYVKQGMEYAAREAAKRAAERFERTKAAYLAFKISQ